MFSLNQKDETIRVLGQAAINSIGGKYKIEWATRLILEGIETEALMILASMSYPLNDFEIEEYFNRALGDLGIERPSSTYSIWRYAELIAREAIHGKITPSEAAFLLKELNIPLDYPEHLSAFVELDDAWYCEAIKGYSESERDQVILSLCRSLIVSINERVSHHL